MRLHSIVRFVKFGACFQLTSHHVSYEWFLSHVNVLQDAAVMEQSVIVIILLSADWTCLSKSTESPDPLSWNDTFTCENGQQIALEHHNDGEVDCLDNTDEYEDPILFYVASPIDLQEDFFGVVGTFIRSKRTFRQRLDQINPCDSPGTFSLLDTHETRIYFMCEEAHNRDRVFYINRTIAARHSIRLPGRNIHTLAFDQITSNLYLLQNGLIEICDGKFTFCSILQQRFRQKEIHSRVVDLAFSSEKGSLVWIEEQISDAEWYLMKSRRDGSQERRIFSEGSKSRIAIVTIDQSSHRMYWSLEGNHETEEKTIIYSSNLDGSDRKLVTKDLFNLQAIAVNRGQLFWRSNHSDTIKSCAVHNDTSNVSSLCSPIHDDILSSHASVGKNLVIYSGRESITPEKLGEKYACGYHTHSPCSKLCTYVSSMEPICFCNNANGSLRAYPHNSFSKSTLTVVLLALLRSVIEL